MKGIVYETKNVNIPNLLGGWQTAAAFIGHSKAISCQLNRIKQTIKALKEIGHTTSADIITIMQTANSHLF